ncbi:DNA (cytosine-5)-methyltransferase 1 [Rhodopseudomonas thermotolerans]|uniref:DNA (cytosine-5-)-methyltransferase n=2 Tax=Rhodopseudomonas TaxID=1073 RepID=A0A336JUH3_9BRAD|nr:MULTISPECIES: DNA cytosine methyltransferase [Rhodopseudomonas]RED25794.1 DNA (cytosine-5)-methyltransferase 1 [Rhodopseudomonas pentothenatexigens]REF90423.1 DNA (cytosine-5)-methyltransferase 1 [Rhodopseudomonas thermotolerans]SSW93122.1 DNA (cytosine-5)-methyltransferase 1 [Rhodopseudomonas pentothenatexigens]
MTLVDLFCGCGGFSLGAHKAGFDVAAAFDVDATLTSSFHANFPKTRLYLRDVGKLTGVEITKLLGRSVTGIFGGPPCQGFSDIGRRDASDPRRKLLSHFFRIVSELKPLFFVMENVRGLVYEDSRGVLGSAIEQVAGQYDILGPLILDAADFGAATRRRRVFVVGIHKKAKSPLLLSDIRAFERPAATVRSAIADLVDAEPLGVREDNFDYWRITRRGRPSEYARSLRSHDGLFASHRMVEHKADVARRFASVAPGDTDPVGRHPRLAWDGQCPTLRAGTGADKGSRQAVRPLHPEEPRVITVREAARLQGFPDRHIFHPTIWHSFRMIGNSVSPIVSQAVFLSIRKKLGLASIAGLVGE